MFECSQKSSDNLPAPTPHPAPHHWAVLFSLSGYSATRLWGKHGDRFLITVLVEDEAVMLFDSYFTLESKLGLHRLFLRVESTRGIRTLVVVFEFLEEMVAWGCRNGKFNKQFQIFPLELKVKFIWIAFVCISDGLDVPAWFISVTFHVDKSLKMAAKLGDCRK